MTNYLRGRVIRILDDQRVIINLGAEQGVKPGDRFFIYESGDMIVDPETGQPLGSLELVKGEVEAVHIQDKMAFMMPLRKEEQSVKTVLSATLQQISPAGRLGIDNKRDVLNVRPEQIHTARTAGPVAVGDAVRSANANATD